MRLSCPEYELDLALLENKVNVLVIEHHAVMAELVQELYNQCNGNDGIFVLSEDNKILPIGKHINLMTDIFSLNCNDKKIISKLHQELEQLAEENLIQESMEISAAIASYLESMCELMPYHVGYQPQILPSMIMKMVDLKFETQTTTLLESVVEYLGIVNKIFKYDVNIFVNLKLFLTTEEIQSLYEYVFYNKIPLLLIEGVSTEGMRDEETVVIDVDKCTIKI